MDDTTTVPAPSDPRDARIAELEAQLAAALKRIAELEARIDELTRRGKRQAAPFSKGPPRLNPKRPGRKPGEGYGTPPTFRAMPEPAPSDQGIEVPAPAVCPACGDASTPVVESIDQQVQRDIEVRTVVRRFKITVCRCLRCGRRRRGQHPLQTSAATGCCASQIGPMARSVMAFMNKTMGTSIGKIADFFGTLWKLDVTRGGVSHAIASIGHKCRDNYDAIRHAVANSDQVTCDETGWRVAGRGAWLHAAATREALAYTIDPGRGKEATDQLIGERYGGTMVHDGWAPYNRYVDAIHQQCDAHILRRCEEMIQNARGSARRLPNKIKSILKRALRLRDERDRGERTLRSTRIHAGKLTGLIRRLCKPRKTNPANERLAGFLYRHAGELFTFLRAKGIDATNFRGEQAIRGAVVNRKVWGGNRTWNGACVQSILMSVLNSLRLRKADAIGWLHRKLLQQNPPILE